MNIRQASQAVQPQWDEYVSSSGGGLPQHLFAWQNVMQDVYGYETHYIYAEVGNVAATNGDGIHIAGVLPLYVNASPLLGRTVTSMPGGLCADDSAVGEALLAQGMEYARSINAKRFVVHDSRTQWPGELSTVCAHEAWTVDLHAGEEALWSALHRNIRRQVRIARKNELSVEIDREGALLDEFYDVLGQFSHSAGTPVYSKVFLQSVVENFPDGFNIVMIYAGGTAIAGYFQLELRDTVYGVWGAALREYFDLRPVYLGYWSIIADAVERGFSWLDMGRAPRDSNASKYKGQWNGEAAPVYQQSASLRGGQENGNAATQAQSDKKFQIMRQIWPKLPYPVAQHLGPKLRRHVPFA